MNWYLAKMIFSATTHGGQLSPEFDIQTRLIKSRNEQEALMKSLVIGGEEEKVFLSEIGEVIKWSFVDVAELTPLPNLQDDLSIYFQHGKEEERMPVVLLLPFNPSNFYLKFQPMNWYLAKIIFSVKTGNGNHTPQFDMQLRLISANNKEEALQKAHVVGNEEEEIFLSESGEMVRWIFVDVVELNALPSLHDGMQLYSQIEEKEEASSFIHFIRDKAANLERQSDVTFA